MKTLTHTIRQVYFWFSFVVSVLLIPVSLIAGSVIGFFNPSFKKWFNDSIDDQPNDGATMILFWPMFLLDMIAHPLELFTWKCWSCSWRNTNNLDRCDACGIYI